MKCWANEEPLLFAATSELTELKGRTTQLAHLILAFKNASVVVGPFFYTPLVFLVAERSP